MTARTAGRTTESGQNKGGISTQARSTEMTKTVRARYTLEFKQEAVRLVAGGQSVAACGPVVGFGRSDAV